MTIVELRHAARIVSLAGGLTLASTVSLSSQVAGVVHDPAGNLIPQATVALWKGQREIARTITDPTGSFNFSVEASDDATVLLVRRIGFRPTSLALSGQRSSLSVTLEPIAVALPEVVTTAARRACPNHDEPEARRLWHAMSEHYATHPRNNGLWASMFWSHREVMASEVGEVDESRLPPGEYAIVGDMREGYFKSLRRDGYARRLSLGQGAVILPVGAYLHWRYLPLHRELSEHFVESDFAARHTLGLWRTDDGSFTITFCGRDHSQPYLEGTLTVSPDTALRSARWQFRTPSPHEDAGAEVIFLAPQPGETIWLLVPMRSVYWRRIGGSKTLYFQEASVYREWYIGPDVFRMDRSGRLTTHRPW